MLKEYKKLFLLLFFVVVGVAISATGCSCGDDIGIQTNGIIKTSLPGERRANLIFTNAIVNKKNEQTFEVWNEGKADVSISEIYLKGVDKSLFKVKHPSLPLVLKPGEAKKKVTVFFLPKTAGQFEALLGFSSGDALNVENDGAFYVRILTQELVPQPSFDCKKLIQFGKVALGKTLEKTCVITNAGSADLEIKGITYKREKNDTDAYEIVSPKSFPIKLKQGGESKLELKIRFKPTSYPPAEAVGSFLLETNIQGETEASRHKVKVIGLIKVGLIELIPMYPSCQKHADCQRIDLRLVCLEDKGSGQKTCRQKSKATPLMKFPLTSPGKSTTRKFLIRSIGELPIQINRIELGLNSDDFKVTDPGLPFSLDPNSDKIISVSYSPKTAKPGKGTLVVFSNAVNKSKAPMILEASSEGCDLQVKPQKLTFTGSKSYPITLLNRGTLPCLVKSIAMKSGKIEPFSILPSQSLNQTIAPRQKLSFLVKFTPKRKVTEVEAVVITSNDPDEPVIEVSLEGRQNTGPQCNLETSPNQLNFSLVAAGRSRKKSLRLINKGWGDCIISSLRVSNLTPVGFSSFRLASNTPLPFKMSAGSHMRLDVVFTPPAAKPSYTGELVVSRNGVQDFRISLRGASGTLCLEVVPANIDFGSTKPGCATKKRSIEIYNIGVAGCISPINISKINCAPTDCFPIDPKSEFRIDNAPVLPKNLSKGQQIEIGLSYKSVNIGIDSRTLEVHNNIPGQSPIQIPLIGEGVNNSEQKDVFAQRGRPIADILFIIDNSCSMRDEQVSLGKNLHTFIQWAVQLNVDFHIGVTTTDITNRPYPAGCFQGKVKIITSKTPNAIQEFRNNTNLGTRGSGIEIGLEGAYRALIPPTLTSPSCNRGFLRKQASLSLIFVSDQNDLGKTPVQFYISFFKSIKGHKNLNLVRASVIVGPLPSGCQNPGTGRANAGPRYLTVAKALGGISESICSSNWATKLSNIGSITFGYRKQFFLSRQADLKTIQVKVNGSLVKQSSLDGWQYDASNNSISFSKSKVPSPRSVIVINYKAICLP